MGDERRPRTGPSGRSNRVEARNRAPGDALRYWLAAEARRRDNRYGVEVDRGYKWHVAGGGGSTLRVAQLDRTVCVENTQRGAQCAATGGGDIRGIVHSNARAYAELVTRAGPRGQLAGVKLAGVKLAGVSSNTHALPDQ